MEKQTFILWVMISVFLPACTFSPMIGVEGDFQLTVAHMNDTHSFIEPALLKVTPMGEDAFTVETSDIARTVTKVAQLRSEHPNLLFLHAGDMTQGSFYSMRYHGDSDLFFFNLMELDGMVTGNHEFDHGPEKLSEFISKAQFPFLVANIESQEDAYLQNSFFPYKIKYLNNEPVGIIGLVTKEVAEISSPGKDLKFSEVKLTAQNTIDELESKGVDKIIILSHIYYENDKKLAGQLHGVDIIVGGHSHSLLGNFHPLGLEAEGEYPTVMKDSDGHPVLVVQAWEYGKALGVLNVDFDSRGYISSYNGQPIIVISDTLRNGKGELLTGNALVEARKIVDQQPGLEVVDRNIEAAAQAAIYKKGIEQFETKVVGRADTDLPHVRQPTDALPGGSMIAPAVCDAFLWKARVLGTKADLVIQNSGGVRIDIKQGSITVADVYTLLPFKNTMAVISLTGGEIKQLFESVLSNIYDMEQGDGAFPYVAGMRYQIKKNGLPGERVRFMELQLASDKWEPMKNDKTYRVVFNSYLASGKSGYDLLATKKVDNELSFIDSDIFMEYLQKKGHIGFLEPRISVE